MKIGLAILGIIAIILIAYFGLRGLYKPARNSTQNQTQSNTPATVTVSIKNFTFSPSAPSIAIGQEVTFINNDNMDHTVTADNGSFDSGVIPPGGTFKKVFDSAGLFNYHCSIHPSMKAKVEVQ